MAILTLGLQNLRRQVDEAFPGRDKNSDGWIGDEAHQLNTSGHNPDDTAGSKAAWNGDPDSIKEVRAWDMDSDLGQPGVDAQDVVDHLRALPGLATVIRYMIYNHRQYHSRNGFAPTTYTGPSPHEEHIHFEGAWTQAADNNTSFDFRLEEIPVALTAADKTWLEALVARVVDARLDAAEASLVAKLPPAVGTLKVNVKPGRVYPAGSPNAGQPWPDWQDWSRVDAYGAAERHQILDAVRALEAGPAA